MHTHCTFTFIFVTVTNIVISCARAYQETNLKLSIMLCFNSTHVQFDSEYRPQLYFELNNIKFVKHTAHILYIHILLLQLRFSDTVILCVHVL